jgi:hypothetical protein
VKDAVWAWLHELAAAGYGEGTQKLVTGYGKSLNVAGDYIERERRVCYSATVNLFLLLFCIIFLIPNDLHLCLTLAYTQLNVTMFFLPATPSW